MQDDFRQMLLGAAKWSIVAIVASIGFYCVAPRYQFIGNGQLRCDRISGKTHIATSYENDTIVYGSQHPQKKKVIVKEEEDYSRFFADLPPEDESCDDYDPRDDQPGEYNGSRG